MKKEIIYKKIFKTCFFALLMTYITLYFSQVTGYYEYQQSQKVLFTEDQIKQFEQDVNNGVNLDINEYIKNDDVNYENSISKLGLNISDLIGETLKTSIESTFTYLSKLVEE